MFINSLYKIITGYIYFKLLF